MEKYKDMITYVDILKKLIEDVPYNSETFDFEAAAKRCADLANNDSAQEAQGFAVWINEQDLQRDSSGAWEFYDTDDTDTFILLDSQQLYDEFTASRERNDRRKRNKNWKLV